MRLASRYHVIAPIAEGTTGVVYRALDEHTGSKVAIKALGRTLEEDELRRFWRETANAGHVRHPNVCSVHHVGFEGGTLFVVREYLEGETLPERMRHSGVFSVADTVAIGVQILEGLAATHAVHAPHRNVAPGNVFLTTPPGRAPFVKLIDFGLPPLTSESETNVTALMPGAPQVSGRPDPELSRDIWTSGLTLFQMLTAPFGAGADGFEKLGDRIRSTPLPSARDFRGDVPSELDAVLMKALAKRMADRFLSVAGFRTALIAAWAQHRTRALARGLRFIKGATIEETAKMSWGEGSLDED